VWWESNTLHKRWNRTWRGPCPYTSNLDTSPIKLDLLPFVLLIPRKSNFQWETKSQNYKVSGWKFDRGSIRAKTHWTMDHFVVYRERIVLGDWKVDQGWFVLVTGNSSLNWIPITYYLPCTYKQKHIIAHPCIVTGYSCHWRTYLPITYLSPFQDQRLKINTNWVSVVWFRRPAKGNRILYKCFFPALYLQYWHWETRTKKETNPPWNTEPRYWYGYVCLKHVLESWFSCIGSKTISSRLSYNWTFPTFSGIWILNSDYDCFESVQKMQS
jgi:hypothetical protein